MVVAGYRFISTKGIGKKLIASVALPVTTLETGRRANSTCTGP
jgi:hypothetical protein